MESLFVKDVMRPAEQSLLASSRLAATHTPHRNGSSSGETVAYAGEPLTAIVYRMAETGLVSLPVLDLSAGGDVVGEISLADLLAARRRIIDDDNRRQRFLRFRPPREVEI